MLVPKTAMYEYNLLVSGKNDVRAAGKVLSVQSEAVAHGVEQLPHFELRTGVLGLNRLHNAAALFFGSGIHLPTLADFLHAAIRIFPQIGHPERIGPDLDPPSIRPDRFRRHTRADVSAQTFFS